MPDNITENNLMSLAIKLNISIKHGWKKALRERLKKKNPSIISDWISLGVPDNFQNILEGADIDPAIWCQIVECALSEQQTNYPPSEDTTTPTVKESSPFPASGKKLSWEMQALIASMQRQIDNLADTVKKYEKTNQDMWGVVNALRNKTDNIDKAQLDLGNEIGGVKNRMFDAARSGDIKMLGG